MKSTELFISSYARTLKKSRGIQDSSRFLPFQPDLTYVFVKINHKHGKVYGGAAEENGRKQQQSSYQQNIRGILKCTPYQVQIILRSLELMYCHKRQDKLTLA